MGYFGFLKELLRPLGYYDLDEGLGAMELHTQGGELDRFFDELSAIEREAFLMTAESFGLAAFEEIAPSRPMSYTSEDRRQALMALLQIDGFGFTPEALNSALKGCGISAVVRETGDPMTLKVSFPGKRGIPVGFQGIKKRIEGILPCHLQIDYLFTFIRWFELECLGPWEALENTVSSWDVLEKYA